MQKTLSTTEVIRRFMKFLLRNCSPVSFLSEFKTLWCILLSTEISHFLKRSVCCGCYLPSSSSAKPFFTSPYAANWAEFSSSNYPNRLPMRNFCICCSFFPTLCMPAFSFFFKLMVLFVNESLPSSS